MSRKSLIISEEGVTHVVLKLMHEDITPEDAAENYEFASQELKSSFIEGLTLGQGFVREIRRFCDKGLKTYEPTQS